MIISGVSSLTLGRARCDQRRIGSVGHPHLVSSVLLSFDICLCKLYCADGTLRWQAPEMMGGNHNFLTQEMDIYAFAICSVEILDKGAMPWQHQDDGAVIRFVLG